jgi:hypothetical protein
MSDDGLDLGDDMGDGECFISYLNHLFIHSTLRSTPSECNMAVQELPSASKPASFMLQAQRALYLLYSTLSNFAAPLVNC